MGKLQVILSLERINVRRLENGRFGALNALIRYKRIAMSNDLRERFCVISIRFLNDLNIKRSCF